MMLGMEVRFAAHCSGQNSPETFFLFSFGVKLYLYNLYIHISYIYLYIWFESIRFSSTDANLRIASHGATAANLWSLAAL